MAERKTPKRKPATRRKAAARKPAPRPKRPTAITATGLVRVFKGGVRAVDGIDLEVAEGEIYGFLGPNGAGKSTTVKMLTTLLTITSGNASVAGVDVAVRHMAGRVPACVRRVRHTPAG